MGTDPLSSFLDDLAPISPTSFGSSGAGSAFSQFGMGAGAGGISSAEEIAGIASKTTDKGYRRLVRHINTTSYSILESLHSCARSYALDKIKANIEVSAGMPEPLVKDFVYGHAVGAGAQGLLAAGNNLTAGQFACFVSWAAPFDAWQDKPGKLGTTKNLVSAMLAVGRFHDMLANDPELSCYEVMMVEINGQKKPAIELAFCLDTGDGYQYYGHIDVIVRHKFTGRVAILELKTTALTTLQPAMYANSNQALGYALALDMIAPGLADYEVIYCSYQVGIGAWHVLPFHKSKTHKAEWVQDLLLDHQRISSYRKLNHYPKNGSSCMKYNRPCRWFGECDFINKQATANLPVLDLSERAEEVDYYFTLADVLSGINNK